VLRPAAVGRSDRRVLMAPGLQRREGGRATGDSEGSPGCQERHRARAPAGGLARVRGCGYGSTLILIESTISWSSTWSAAWRVGSDATPCPASHGDVSGKSVVRMTNSVPSTSTILN